MSGWTIGAVNVNWSDQHEDGRQGRRPLHEGKARATSRRLFLKRTLAMGAAALVSRSASVLGDERFFGGSTRPTTNALPTISRVAHVVSERVLPVRIVQPVLLRDCLEHGLCAAMGERDIRDAWYRVLAPDDVILIKFNQSGAVRIGTTPAMVKELVGSLNRAGWGPDKMMLLEAGTEAGIIRKTRPVDHRWQGKEVAFRTVGKDSFLAAVEEATAIINVPFLKTHHRATMTCCLKNLSHGLIRHPARFHANGCDPAIGEIAGSQPIRGKARLNIVNALRVVFNGGPEAAEQDTHASGALLIGTDPVACDAVGYGLLNEIRSLHDLGPLVAGAQLPRQLVTAGKLGLGTIDSGQIDVQRITL